MSCKSDVGVLIDTREVDSPTLTALRYYVWSLDVKDTIILVPEVQFKHFLGELNESFPHEMLDPAVSESQWRSSCLLVDFPEHPRLAPRFLGVSDSNGAFDRLCRRIPVQSSRGPD